MMDPMAGPSTVTIKCDCGFEGDMPYDFYPGEAPTPTFPGADPAAVTECPRCDAIIDVLALLDD